MKSMSEIRAQNWKLSARKLMRRSKAKKVLFLLPIFLLGCGGAPSVSSVGPKAVWSGEADLIPVESMIACSLVAAPFDPNNASNAQNCCPSYLDISLIYGSDQNQKLVLNSRNNSSFEALLDNGSYEHASTASRGDLNLFLSPSSAPAKLFLLERKFNYNYANQQVVLTDTWKTTATDRNAGICTFSGRLDKGEIERTSQ